jgi:hypothetical protein
VPLGDVVYPMYSDSGELVGFHMRPELLLLLHVNNGFNLKILRRAIKTCNYMTRLIRYGKDQDFLLVSLKEGEQ